MKLLLDTHVLIWMVQEPQRLSKRVADAILDQANEIFVSAATAWEIANKLRLGKMAFDQTFLDDFDARIQALGLMPMVVTAKHAVAGACLPGQHRDPFDRLLSGQAQVEAMTVVTKDAQIAQFGVPVLW